MGYSWGKLALVKNCFNQVPNLTNGQFKHNDAKDSNKNAAALRRICKRSDLPKIERLKKTMNARLILRRKLKGATT